MGFFFSQKKCLLRGGIFIFPPILKLEVRFFSDRKRFLQIFENRIFFFHLNFISIKKNQRTFLDHHHPPILKLEVGIFSDKKSFFAKRLIKKKKTYFKLMSKISANFKNIF